MVEIFHETIANRREGRCFVSARERIRGESVGAKTHARRSANDWVPDERRIRRVFVDYSFIRGCTRDVLEHGFLWAGQLAGGTHHAFAGHGEGFCVFNDIACAVRVAQRDYKELFEGEEKNVLIVDLDVHQGNGTARIFENDKNVITYSIHGDRNYPWKTRMMSDYDIALPDECEDGEYLKALKESLPKVFERHRPFLVYFQAGVDALKADSFGRLSMTREGLRKRNNIVLALCVEYNCKLVTTMGGGYAKPIERSVECHSDVFEA